MKTRRHAYCIIAHTDFYCLEKLIALIDDPRNDIFLVLDRKSSLRNLSLPKTQFSRIITPPDSQLIDIHWGGRSQLEAELLVFQTAYENGDYDYFHLLSGQDLPLKNQDYIHDYFEKIVDGRICISCEHGLNVDAIHRFNCGYYHLFVEKTRCPNLLIRKGASFLRRAFIGFQRLLKYQRSFPGLTLGKGTGWISSNREFIQYLVLNKEKIIKRFTGVLGPDEIYKHTLFLSTDFKTMSFSETDITDNLRHIDWKRGRPYVWRKSDLDELMSCNELFARKFSSSIDKEIIDLIYSRLTKVQEETTVDEYEQR